MSKSKFKIQTIRKTLNDDNLLYIKGYYLENKGKAKIRVYADKTELKCSETKILDYVNNYDELGDCEDIKKESEIFAILPEKGIVKTLKFVYEDGMTSKTILTLSGDMLEKAMTPQVYNIDAFEKIENHLIIRGWIIYENEFNVRLYDDENKEFKVDTKLYERMDVGMAYPELNKNKKISGFQCEFEYKDERNLGFELMLDEKKIHLLLDTRSDFSGNKRILPMLVKAFKQRGFWGTVLLLFDHFKHPILLTKRISNKIGLTSLLIATKKRIRSIKYRIAVFWLSKVKYAELTRFYPNAVKRLACLREMDSVKREKKKHLTGDVKFSVLVPLFNTPVHFLNEMIESVQIQTYENWELCLADGSDEQHSYVEEICKAYQEKDSRILYKRLNKNYGISGNTNECIKMATGNFIALFDHDDFLHPLVLQKCYDVIKSDDADYVYTDEATFEADLYNIGTYHFKPDYAPDTLRANNYICHFSTFSKALLDEVGWYDSQYDGSQDHELILRLTENAKCVKHIQEILYFWRSHPGSVASDINSKVYAIEAGKSAVKASLERNGMSGCVESSKAFPTIYRIKYDLKETAKITIIIPNRNHATALRKCIESICNKSTYRNYEIIIVDRNSNQKEIFDYYDELKSDSRIKILEWDKCFNYSAMNNFALKHADGKYVLFLNSGIQVISPEWMEELLMYAQRKDVAAVGGKIYYPNNLIRYTWTVLGTGKRRATGCSHYMCHRYDLGYMGRLYYSQNVSAVSAACMLIRKSIVQEIGGFDETYVSGYHDTDLCLKAMQKGYLNVFTPYAELYCYAPVSAEIGNRKKDTVNVDEDINKFKKKWEEVLKSGDKYYNKNFSLDSTLFEVKNNDLFLK